MTIITIISSSFDRYKEVDILQGARVFNVFTLTRKKNRISFMALLQKSHCLALEEGFPDPGLPLICLY